MVFQESDAGPFWMSAEEREAKRHDKVKEGTTSTRTLQLEELKTLLQEKDLLARGKKTELIKRCEDNGIRTIEIKQKIEEGWQGKPKGLLQILWERGWIDANKSISRDIITTEMIRKFSKRACEYIIAYYKVWQKNQEQAEATTDLPVVDETTTPVEIQKIIKLFKTHRCAMDFDSSFCKASFKGDDTMAQ